jgi:hypothetical protein
MPASEDVCQRTSTPRVERIAAKELILAAVGQSVTVIEVVSWTVEASDAESLAVFE